MGAVRRLRAYWRHIVVTMRIEALTGMEFNVNDFNNSRRMSFSTKRYAVHAMQALREEVQDLLTGNVVPPMPEDIPLP